MSYPVTAILKNTVISISMSFEELKKIDDYCRKFNVSRSELMRDAVNLVLWMREEKSYIDPRKLDEIAEYYDAIEREARQQNEATCAPE